MESSELRIALVGVTGAVGRVALDLLAERNWPADRIVPMASKRSAGRTVPYMDTSLTVIEATPEAFMGVDVAFISASSAVSKALAPEAVKRGVLVIDDGSAFRMEPTVPLVVPEVNGEDVTWHQGIISIPNCTTTPLVMVLAALNAVNPLTRVTIATYQSVSGTGAAAVQELHDQNAALAAGREVVSREYPHQIAMNVLPHVDAFHDDGYTGEEHKMINETRKIMGLPQLAISPTCVRVPVPVSHSESVQAELRDPITATEARRILAGFSGIVVVDEPDKDLYPMPHQAAGRDEVLVGRIRQDLSLGNGLVLWLSCDNLRKGAALNAFQIMDEVVRRDALRPASATATR